MGRPFLSKADRFLFYKLSGGTKFVNKIAPGGLILVANQFCCDRPSVVYCATAVSSSLAHPTFTFYFGQAASTSTGSAGDKRSVETMEIPLGPSKHRKSGVDQLWYFDFPWLQTSEDDCGEPKMWCSVCCKSNC